MIISSTRTRQNDARLPRDGGIPKGSFLEVDASQFPFPSARLETNPNAADICPEDIQNALGERPDRERIRMLLVGSPLGVTRTIQTLDRLSFVELHRWSQLTGAPEQLHLDPRPGEVLSILTRYWLRRS